ncbi:YjfK family protein [Psychrosphaera algicola]
MFSKLFGKSKEKAKVATPEIMGLRIGGSFDIDPLLLRLSESELITDGCAPTHIIQAAGLVDMDGTFVFRFYTDDDAFLQVIAEGGKEEHNIIDVKLFHFYDTQDIPTQELWDDLLKNKIGQPSYQLLDHTFERVWTSAGTYHNPVHMCENTFDENGESSETDQFTMLFERPISSNNTESLFLSAEEKLEP